jgi:hypothetical protein
MTFAQRRNRLTTHFSERIPVVNRGISVFVRYTLNVTHKTNGYTFRAPPCVHSVCHITLIFIHFKIVSCFRDKFYIHMQYQLFFPHQLVCSASAWRVCATKTSRLKLFEAMIGIYCQSEMQHSQHLGGHDIACCKPLVLNLLVLPACYEFFFATR